jgi:hypothetical protein
MKTVAQGASECNIKFGFTMVPTVGVSYFHLETKYKPYSFSNAIKLIISDCCLAAFSLG